MKRWTLIEGWKRLWWKLWSVKLSILAALLSGIEVAVGVILDGKPALFAVCAMLVSLGAGASRIVAQPALKE